MKHIIDDQVVLSRPLEGPLATHIAAFARWAREEGYALQSRYRRVLLAACFSRWLGQQAVRLRRVSVEHPARYPVAHSHSESTVMAVAKADLQIRSLRRATGGWFGPAMRNLLA